MKKGTMLLVVFLAMFSVNVSASAFCDGFKVGYQMIKGNNAFVPFCPFEPFTPFGSTPYQEGIKAGMKAAER